MSDRSRTIEPAALAKLAADWRSIIDDAVLSPSTQHPASRPTGGAG
jgi:hypothetical protein